MKKDPYNTKYLDWENKVSKGIPELSKANSDLILQYLEDMEKRLNVVRSTKKGSRSYMN
jgi:hypothetical protein